MPCIASRKATESPPALGELMSGVSYAFQVLPASVVARMRETVAPPVVIHAFESPCVVMQVPLEENEASPERAGGIAEAIECQCWPLKVRMSGNTPFTESLCATPRLGSQKAMQS